MLKLLTTMGTGKVMVKTPKRAVTPPTNLPNPDNGVVVPKWTRDA